MNHPLNGYKQNSEHIKNRVLSRRKNGTYTRLGKENSQWKETGFGMKALHNWVKRWLGRPDTCEFCGKAGLSGCKIHWANKSHQYKRDLSDWLRLCAKCHWHYDRA